jgi:hypothetical protein
MRSAKILYAVAIFLSSSLLFLAEPMAGKRLLPLLGGSAAVWTTCLVFFQTALLLGYLGAHALTTRLSMRAQAIAYSVLLALCLAQLSRTVNPNLRADPAHPILSVLWLLTLLIGAPFLLLSATSPLLQAWYARSASSAIARGDDPATVSRPYRLFAVSNFGSLLALVIYPWMIEPRFSLRQQSVVWMAGFVAFACLCVCLGYSIRNVSNTRETTWEESAQESRITAADCVLWILLAACGSLLLSAVTNYLSQNVAAIPLLWIIPLVLYLLSFVVAFSGAAWLPRWLVLLLFPAALAPAAYVLYDPDLALLAKLRHVSEVMMSLPWEIALFSGALFFSCLFCHAELYRLRPAPQRLTTFYLCIAGGGALGAIFVGVAAPTLFSGNYELACGLVLAAALGFAISWKTGRVNQPVIWMTRVFWLAATVAMVKLIFVQVRNDQVDLFLQVRSFYGTLSVLQTVDPPEANTTRSLYHGTIEHGMQIFSPEMRTEPTTYYSRDSGVGLALDLCCRNRPRRVGVIGLGTGTLAAYGASGDVFRFYEINAQVEAIARNAFTYLRESKARIEIVPGDARISLAAEPAQRYDVLIIDAFSGDAIPVHLLTVEALDLYRRHMQPSGIIAFHVTNHFLNLAPVVQQQAEHAGLKAALIVVPDDDEHAAFSSDWVLVTANTEFLNRPEIAAAQEPIVIPHGLRLWTDDYNSLLPILKTEADEK